MEEWPAHKIQPMKVDDLVPYENNSRTHSDAQIDQIAKSIEEWGFTNPVLITETGMIIAGHGRVMAAKKLGIEIVPCVVAKDWSEAQIKAYVIADNKLALNAGWDNSVLKQELIALDGEGIDLGLTGFSDAELHLFLVDGQQVNPKEEWVGMPEYEGKDPCYRKIVVNFDDDQSVRDFYKIIGQEYSEKAKFVWHPYKERRDLESQRWSDE